LSVGFAIPVARDELGRLISPADARKHAVYTCPLCSAPVDLHAGEKKRRHFHHRAGTSTCTSESILHLCAKQLVKQAVDDWLEGSAGAPVFVRTCADPSCEATTKQMMPKKVARCAVEHHLRTGHVADIALLARAADLPVGVIEIHHSHAVDEAKAIELAVPWIEVEAAQVCADGGRVLVPVRDRFIPWLCPAHIETRGDAHAQRRIDRERLAALAKRLDYRLSDYPAYRVEHVTKCQNGHDAIVFTWEGAGSSPPDPRPPHVVASERELDTKFERRGGRRKLLPYRRSFVSICPSCGERVSARD
jgi:hypothetical protein